MAPQERGGEKRICGTPSRTRSARNSRLRNSRLSADLPCHLSRLCAEHQVGEQDDKAKSRGAARREDQQGHPREQAARVGGLA
eukprot:CAMPEP_0179119892 /NCGR_PEP_ID=MMETSP0796-20121207/56464_1 /TAXON_ID=73915 /ORGANISM="Pyrodinium bahamense, Strain pbaha01" /LENGTH=82 /DNA_ID=CAMNT_0020818417 /DNA_START=165 /DNA_END=410 /DNA_ORIENTATION=+